jgi:hypothetical protein
MALDADHARLIGMNAWRGKVRPKFPRRRNYARLIGTRLGRGPRARRGGDRRDAITAKADDPVKLCAEYRYWTQVDGETARKNAAGACPLFPELNKGPTSERRIWKGLFRLVDVPGE